MDLIKQAKILGASDIGFCKIDGKQPDRYANLSNAISVVYTLNKQIVKNIVNKPTYEYFHHYRTVNFKIDQITLELSKMIEDKGYNAIPIASSQSIPNGENGFNALISHKIAGVKSGLGFIGKSNLFVSKKFGSCVRLGTVLTDMPLPFEKEVNYFERCQCGDCTICQKACPTGAISGEVFDGENTIFSAEKCSHFMKANFMKIGRGSVCGICMAVCPFTKKYIES